MNKVEDEQRIIADICGNICESGDLIAKGRRITKTAEEDILVIMDAGAYGDSAASVSLQGPDRVNSGQAPFASSKRKKEISTAGK